MAKYIFVTGGVCSSLGKGITVSSIGAILKARGFNVSALKFDPYLNVDAGTMNPYQHGEVFVTEDGAETDLDLGHYERFMDVYLTSDHNVTAGKVYQSVILKEREGRFLGATVQVIPHVTDEIKNRIRKVAKGLDVLIVEVGGTVGDIEGLPFLEAIRQLRVEEGFENTLYVHVTLVPYLKTAGETKTKPTQHSVNELRRIGIQPDILVCRTERALSEEAIKKIALFSNLPVSAVIEARDARLIYEVPLNLENKGLGNLICRKLGLPAVNPNLTVFAEFLESWLNPVGEVNVAVVGKYVKHKDAYISVAEALMHAAVYWKRKLNLRWIDAEEIKEGTEEKYLSGADGILVPGGFGFRGIEGKMRAIKYARENKIPFLGLCFGMQCAVIEFARNVCGLSGANTTEVDPATPHPVIDLLPEQRKLKDLGGTMRLGSYPCRLLRESKSFLAYGEELIYERHRHRYEFNNEYRELLSSKGLKIVGTSPNGSLVEIVELDEHPWFVGVQFHPEFKSRPYRPNPLFREFLNACIKQREGRL
ncbi:MAG: CTP synthase [Synergistetes bacterium]|nr:CTP synthase [Synergistota bacterium]MDK2871328.1 synthase [bacterium]